MSSPQLYGVLLPAMFLLAPVVFVALFFVSAPYGRHVRAGWGPGIDARIGWLLMEAPACLLFGFLLLGTAEWSLTLVVLFLLWEMHYVHRAFIYPFRLRGGKRMPLAILLMGVCFNLVNGFLNGYYLSAHPAQYGEEFLTSPPFLAGCALFLAGFVVTKAADATLRQLRGEDEEGYAIPRGHLYRWVSCPNYLGETLQWCGWAIACWSPPGLLFALWTLANLMPRARSHHAWYRAQFPDYPRERRAMVPLIY